MSKISPVEFEKGKLILLDQRLLPIEKKHVHIDNVKQVFEAIKDMIVRGAPAIGVTAAYGMVLSANACKESDLNAILRKLQSDGEYLKKARPTAVNLAWAVDRMINKIMNSNINNQGQLKSEMLKEAKKIHKEDIAANRAIGEYALGLLKNSRNILTHCNAGILATTDYGTATSVFYIGKERGIDFHVFADETRPRMQGSRLTAYELSENGIDVTVISDSAAAFLMKSGEIDAVITGADRVAANGDTANKIGTLSVSVNARYFKIPMYIAVPLSTIDISLESGKYIPIEERGREEVVNMFGRPTAPKGIKVRNPAFDVTPAENITAIITEKGIIYPPYTENIQKLFIG